MHVAMITITAHYMCNIHSPVILLDQDHGGLYGIIYITYQIGYISIKNHKRPGSFSTSAVFVPVAEEIIPLVQVAESDTTMCVSGVLAPSG